MMMKKSILQKSRMHLTVTALTVGMIVTITACGKDTKKESDEKTENQTKQDQGITKPDDKSFMNFSDGSFQATVKAIDGTSLTIQMVMSSDMFSMGGPNGQFSGQQGEMPSMPDGDFSDLPTMPNVDQGSIPTMPDGDQSNTPSMPNGDQGEMPSMQGMQIPETTYTVAEDLLTGISVGDTIKITLENGVVTAIEKVTV